MNARLLPLLLVIACAWPASAQDASKVEASIEKAVAFLVKAQEGETQAEWPYEGVYRVRRQIPIGYRIGGTSIVGMSLVQAPGYAEDEERQAAVERAVKFVCEGIEHPLMGHEPEQTRYDVRGWGYTYGLWFLCRLQAQDRIPKGLEDAARSAIVFYLEGIRATEIPKFGGWNYSRPTGFKGVASPSPFMTGSTLQALFEAKAQGHAVEAELVDRGLTALQRCRKESGTYVYAWVPTPRRAEPVPGAVGRMLVGESTLLLAGRGNPMLVRGALDAFFTHWERLNERRAKNGTHKPPFGVAPYYFYYAHYYAAQAIELIPESERPEYRRRLRGVLFSVQLDDGTWNDRVFPRSAAYGTALSIMALAGKDLPPPARWKADAPEKASATEEKKPVEKKPERRTFKK